MAGKRKLGDCATLVLAVLLSGLLLAACGGSAKAKHARVSSPAKPSGSVVEAAGDDPLATLRLCLQSHGLKLPVPSKDAGVVRDCARSISSRDTRAKPLSLKQTLEKFAVERLSACLRAHGVSPATARNALSPSARVAQAECDRSTEKALSEASGPKSGSLP